MKNKTVRPQRRTPQAWGANEAEERFYTTDEVAARYGVSELTVRRWISKGQLAALDVSCGERRGPYRVSLKDIQDFEARQYRLAGGASAHSGKVERLCEN